MVAAQVYDVDFAKAKLCVKHLQKSSNFVLQIRLLVEAFEFAFAPLCCDDEALELVVQQRHVWSRKEEVARRDSEKPVSREGCTGKDAPRHITHSPAATASPPLSPPLA